MPTIITADESGKIVLSNLPMKGAAIDYKSAAQELGERLHNVRISHEELTDQNETYKHGVKLMADQIAQRDGLLRDLRTHWAFRFFTPSTLKTRLAHLYID